MVGRQGLVTEGQQGMVVEMDNAGGRWTSTTVEERWTMREWARSHPQTPPPHPTHVEEQYGTI